MTNQHSQSSKLTKSLLALTVATSLLAGSPLPASAATNNLSIWIDRQPQSLAQSPRMIEDRVYVPVRALLEAFGYEMTWDEKHRQVIGTKGDRRLYFGLDDRYLFDFNPVHDETFDDIPIKIIDGRALISARFLGELLGMDIRWDSKKQAVLIDTTPIAIFDAIMQDDLATVRTLLQNGTDPNSRYRNYDALYYAISSRTPAIAKLLAKQGAVPVEDDYFRVVGQGDADLTRFLLTQVPHQQPTAELASKLLPHSFNNTGMTLTLLGLGADPNKGMKIFDRTSLSYTAIASNTVSVQALLEAGADPNTIVTSYEEDKRSFPLLVALAAYGNIEVSELLLTHGADPNGTTDEGYTPLMLAAIAGNAKLTKLLLTHKADVHALNKYGGNALAIAQANGNNETAQVLLDAGAKEIPVSALPKKALFPIDPDSLFGADHELEKAAGSANTAKVKQLLLTMKIDADTMKESVELAVRSGAVETLQVLLAAGGERKNNNLLDYAMGSRNSEILRILTANKNWNPVTNPEVSSFLGKSIPTTGSDNVPVYKMLLEAGFDPTAPENHSALNTAVAWGYVGLTKLLLEAGADANWADSRQGTALNVAIWKGHTELLNILLTADNLSRSTLGNALLAAVKRDSLEMTTALLKAGADATFTAVDGQTPLQLAETIGNTEMIQLLQEMRAQ